MAAGNILRSLRESDPEQHANSVTEDERSTLAKELDVAARDMFEQAKALREASKAILQLATAERMLTDANALRERALELLSEVKP